jgi:GH24 family phage-related lysozyme (muramidase)
MKRNCLCLALAVSILLGMFGIAPIRVSALALTPSQAFIDVLKQIEGFSATPYKDNTQYSIGYGCYCPDNMVEYYTQNPLSPEDAEIMLLEQLSSYTAAVNDFATDYGLNLKQHQFDALVSFSYNCGTKWMRELDGYFNVAVREMNTGNDMIYGLCLWGSSAGKYILLDRRMCEANMFINGVYRAYNSGGEIYPDSYRWVFLDGGAGTVSYKVCGFDASLAEPLSVAFKKIPVGTDEQGNPFAYTLAGWYTADGRKVERLDSSLTRGQTLYAKWADPQGNIVTPQDQTRPEGGFPKVGTIVNVDESVRVRSGPGTGYSQVGSRYKGEQVTVLEEATGSVYAVNGVNYNTWGKLAENEWVALGYVQYGEDVVTGIQLVTPPADTDYIQPVVYPKTEGSVLLVTYASGYAEAMTVKKSMLSGFDGKQTGGQTVTVNYGGKTATFPVTVTRYVPDTVTSSVYRIEEGQLMGVAPGTTVSTLLAGIDQGAYAKVLSGGQELTGQQTVGTDAMVVLMDGEEFKAAVTVVVRGDVTGDGAVDGNDATLLLQYAAGWDVPINETAADVNGDDKADGNDATLLLQYAAGWNITITQ